MEKLWRQHIGVFKLSEWLWLKVLSRLFFIYIVKSKIECIQCLMGKEGIPPTAEWGLIDAWVVALSASGRLQGANSLAPPGMTQGFSCFHLCPAQRQNTDSIFLLSLAQSLETLSLPVTSKNSIGMEKCPWHKIIELWLYKVSCGSERGRQHPATGL